MPKCVGEASGKPFIEGMNAKMRGRGSCKGVHRGDERQKEGVRQPERRSSRG
ncbi:hypothetical protein PU629_15780 [Pullulanibacillus sp. KACC 23026]|uniref:hypothetical protein n=1 Tax=Pullulanibacillus sp. KACC 23026 TaxID=3028315 RepID=UPI0023B193EF|nr:hypothetical protein [Pullulanibacillus sp. KACC 23026]WEG11603.1 hypothetical protein PU629_15780 [Pullulanibacillus sp. KACC 23026]